MELFIKRFIDLLDEIVPVTMVHTLVEQPLGAVIHDYYIRLHTRLDLANEESPYLEIELYPLNDKSIKVLYAFSYPKSGIVNSETEFVNKITLDSEAQIEKIIPLRDVENYTYELFYDEQIDIPDQKDEIDPIINKLTTKIKDRLNIGGYEVEKEE